MADLLDECLVFMSASATRGSYDAGLGEWDIGGLDRDETVTLEITAEVGRDCGPEVFNATEVIGSSLPDPDDRLTIFDDPGEANDDRDSVSVPNIGG